MAVARVPDDETSFDSGTHQKPWWPDYTLLIRNARDNGFTVPMYREGRSNAVPLTWAATVYREFVINKTIVKWCRSADLLPMGMGNSW
jgi:hypothetical protein